MKMCTVVYFLPDTVYIPGIGGGSLARSLLKYKTTGTVRDLASDLEKPLI